MKLEFEEAVFGVEREITIRRAETCDDCKGTGSANGKQPETCQQCGGRGQVRSQQGFFSVARTCPVCSGTGSVIRTPCTTCKGDTRILREHKILVKVPAGVEQDTRIRYSGEGEAGRFGGPAGDLYVVLDVKPTSSSSATATISTASSPSASRRPHSAPRSKSKHLKASKPSRSPKAHKAARVQAPRQGRPAPQRARQRRPHRRGPRADTRQAHQAAERAAQAALRNHHRREHASRSRPLQQGQGDVQLDPRATHNRNSDRAPVAVSVCRLSHNIDAQTASPAIAAVSARRILGPSVTCFHPLSLNSVISSGVHPPSGPIASATSPSPPATHASESPAPSPPAAAS